MEKSVFSMRAQWPAGSYETADIVVGGSPRSGICAAVGAIHRGC